GGVLAADPAAGPAGLQAERGADAEAETDPVGEAMRDEERAEGLCVAGVPAIAPGERRAADVFVQVRAAVLEEEVRPYQEPGGGDLRPVQKGKASGVVEDGGGVGGDGSLSGVGAAQGTAALLQEQEAGGMQGGWRGDDQDCDQRPGECGERPRHRVPSALPRGRRPPRGVNATRDCTSARSARTQ